MSETAVATVVRDRLAGAIATPALLASVQRRARTERRRRWSVAAAAVLAVVLVAAGVQRGLGAGSLDASSVLTITDVRPFVPAAEVLSPPQRVDPPADQRGRLLGGWCSTTPLDDVPVPEVWSGYWAQPLLSRSAGGSSTFVSQVAEQVLRFDDEAGAMAYATATGASATTCTTGGVQAGSPLPDAYRVPPVAFPGRPHLTLALAPASLAQGAWYVRVVDVRGSAAVDVFALVAAPTARDAGQRTIALLDVALERVPA